MLTTPHHDGSAVYAPTRPPVIGGVVTLRLRTHRDRQPATVALRTVRDGEPHNVMATRTVDDGPSIWWEAELEIRNVVTSYRWLLSGGAFGYAWLNASGLVDHDVPDADDFVLTTHADPPAWTAGAVIYQVFPDRFARGDHADQLGRAEPRDGESLPEWAIPRAWTDPVIGRGPETPFEYFGGDLDGVRQRLAHVQGLGANTVYLTPVFPAGSTHRYDARTFEAIDPLLGGDKALARLNAEAHERGMRVLGDITLNHCGMTHEWFERAECGEAPERDFFRFDPSLEHGYECWLGVPSLPKFDLTSDALLDRLIRAPGSIIRRWIGGPEGFDGWRVDVANMAGRMGEVDVTHDVARSTRIAMAAELDEPLLVAEHNHDASDDLEGDGWHGTMNYAAFTRPVWSWLKSPDFTEGFFGLPVEVPTFTGTQMTATIRAFHGRIPWRSLLASWNILGSHDTARIRSVVGTAERHEAALALCVGLPGVPMVFAGDEIGARGLWGEDARTPFPWHDEDSWDHGTLAAYRTLLTLRGTSPALAQGGLRWVHEGEDVVAFIREHPRESMLIVVARSQAPTLRLPLGELGAHELLHTFGLDARIEAGQAVIDVPRAGAGLWRLA